MSILELECHVKLPDLYAQRFYIGYPLKVKVKVTTEGERPVGLLEIAEHIKPLLDDLMKRKFKAQFHQIDGADENVGSIFFGYMTDQYPAGYMSITASDTATMTYNATGTVTFNVEWQPATWAMDTWTRVSRTRRGNP